MTDWIEVGSVEDIPVLGARVVRRPDVNIALFRNTEDEIFALEDKCPHKGGPLSQGIVHDCRVTCPLHNWVLDLKTGEAVGPDEGRAVTIPIKVESGQIFIKPDGPDEAMRTEELLLTEA